MADDIVHWRAALLDRLLRLVFLVGVVVAVPSIVQAVRVGEWVIATVDVVAVVVVGIMAFVSPIPYRVRATSFVVVLYVLGVGLLVGVGIVAQLYLLAVPVITVILMGMRPAWVALVLNLVTLVAVTARFEVDLLAPRVTESDTASLAVTVVNVAFVGWLLTYSTGRLIGGLEQSLAVQRGIAASLLHEQRRLCEANDELRREAAERRRAEAEVSRLALAVEQSGEAVLIADLAGVIIYANRASQRLVERLGPDVEIPHVDDLLARLEDDPSAPEPDDADAEFGILTVVDAEASRHRFSVKVSPLRDADGVVTNVVVVLSDITQELEYEERLRRSHRLEALGTLASGTAHDFNNLTAAIQMIAETTRATSDDPDVTTNMDTIITTCLRARDVVRQVMVFGRQEKVPRSSVVLSDVVQESIPLVRTMLPPGVHLEVDLAGGVPVLANPSEIQQIVMNLASNAVFAMTADAQPDGRADAEGHRPVGGRLTIAVGADAHGSATLVVSDTGVGIAADRLDRIFDPFFTTKDPGQGSGLGLASVHGLVTSLRGAISVSSTPGAGASFTVTIPRAEHRHPAVASAESTGAEVVDEPGRPGGAASATGDLRAARILVIDDEESIRQIAARHLGRRGHDVTTAVDGIDAVERFDADPDGWDVIVTDLAMPRLDGRGVVTHVRARRPDLPVIVSTGFGELAQMGDLAVQGQLSKPYSLADLAEVVEAVLADR